MLAEVVMYETGHLCVRLPVREWADTVQDHATVRRGEVRLETFGVRPTVAEVRPALEHQRGNGQSLHRAEPATQLVVPAVTRFAGEEAGAVGVERDRGPVGIAEARRGRGELLIVEPSRRTPGVPLLPREGDRVASDRLDALVDVHQPLVPERACLRE